MENLQQATEFALRDVQSSDIASLVRIIKKIGIKNIAKAVTPQEGDNNEAGWELLDLVFDKYEVCQEEIFNFLARLSGLEANVIATQEPALTLKMLKQVIKSPKFVDFLKVAWELLN